MRAKCFKCGKVYGISVFHRIGREGYECPVCEKKRIAEKKNGVRKFFKREKRGDSK